MYTNKIMQLVK